jgi:transcriptional regulator of stress and heat shock response
MRNISDIIEQHLKEILKKSETGSIEIQRNELAELFQCVPSQINYVLSTRFTAEKGYYVESKRGGGGYIRISRVELTGKQMHQSILEDIGRSLSQRQAEDIIERLLEAQMISRREASMILGAIHRDVLGLQIPLRDELRARILASMILALIRHQ